jgi:hypothetical protein
MLLYEFAEVVRVGSPSGWVVFFARPTQNVPRSIDFFAEGPHVLAMAAVEPFLHQPYLRQHGHNGWLQLEFAVVLGVLDLRRAAFRTVERSAQYLSVGLSPLVENLFRPWHVPFVDQDMVGSVGFTDHPPFLPFALVINHRMQSGLLELLANRLRVFSFFEGQNCDWFHSSPLSLLNPVGL